MINCGETAFVIASVHGKKYNRKYKMNLREVMKCMEQKTRKKWKEVFTLKDRILIILQFVISIAVIVLASLQLTGKWESAINVFEPLLGVLMIINGLSAYKFNKIVAYFCFGVGIFIFCVAFWIFFF